MFSKLGIKSVCFDMPKGNADNGVVKLDGDQRNHYPKNDCKTYAQTTTIDRGMEGMKAVPKAMKMDIEGFEGRALAGATRLLKEIKPCYIFGSSISVKQYWATRHKYWTFCQMQIMKLKTSIQNKLKFSNEILVAVDGKYQTHSSGKQDTWNVQKYECRLRT
jgi:hypothetical protein